MAPRGRGATTLRRLGATAGSRLTEGLLSSNGKVAALGLVTALLTLAFTIWFRVELGYQSTVAAPLARTAAQLNASLSQSLAALRGWVAYGDPRSAAERAELWEEQIEPALARLEELVPQSRDAAASGERLAALRRSLRDLKRIQWAIEDVARTPGNQPAAVEYDQRLAPLRRNVLTGAQAAIDQVYGTSDRERPVLFLARLADFRSIFAEADLAMNNLVAGYSQVREREVAQQLTRARALAADLRAELPGLASDDLRRLLEFTLAEFQAYALQVGEVVALGRSDESNVSELLFNRDARPLVAEARDVASTLAATQASANAERAHLFTRASYAVIGMALLMGLISAGSLAVSLRLRRQVENVMAKARMLGQYAIERRLGRGGMGEVYLAQHAMLRRPTAIKLLRPESAQSVRAQARFQKEVQRTCQLSHPHTIEIFDYGRTPEGIFYYAMEYVDGFTLQALVSLGGPVDPGRVVHILLQVCGSLQEAHDAGLLHRDIKPSNIMLTCQGGVPDTVKVLDFGLVQVLADESADEEEEPEVIAGTPMYLAPETILSGEAGTPRSDLYSLGAVAYFLLTGTPVFAGQEVMDVLASHLHEEPEFPSQRLGRKLPVDLEYVLLACLAKDPAERPESAARLAEMLRACDCREWTVEDARLWWDEFGEAARNESVSDDTVEQAVRSGLQIEIEIGPTRG